METCEHDFEFDTDDKRGVCSKCGAECDWHWEKEEGNVEDYHWSGQERVVDEIYSPFDLGE